MVVRVSNYVQCCCSGAEREAYRPHKRDRAEGGQGERQEAQGVVDEKLSRG